MQPSEVAACAWEIPTLSERIFYLLARILEGIFLIGMAGCLVVIPMVAYKLFAALFETDSEEEKRPAASR